MATKTNIRWQERVARPYRTVHDALMLHANEIFHQATRTAESRAENVAADLHTKIAGFEFRKDVLIKINSYTEIEGDSDQRMIVDLEWESASTKFLFPTMKAQLNVLPCGEQTQLDFRGEYAPPLGLLGKAVDAMVGAKIGEACVQHFVKEVVEYLHSAIEPKSTND